MNPILNPGESHSRLTLCLLVALFGLCASVATNAQHSDIWLVLNVNQTAVSPDDLEPGATGGPGESGGPVLVEYESGRFLFQANFDDVADQANGTPNPGFQSEDEFNEGAALYFRALGSLMFWNGTEWTNTVVDKERIQIIDATQVNITTIDVNGVNNPLGGVDVVSGGSVHQHIKFAIDNSQGIVNNGVVAPGAYLIELEVFFTDGINGPVEHTVSDPFHIAFKYQITDAQFDEAILSRLVPNVSVPIPFGFMFVFAALLAVIGCALRSKKTGGSKTI